MAVPNKGTLTLNTPKVLDSKRNPDGPALHLSADRCFLTVHPLKLQMIPSYGNAVFIFLHLLHYHGVPFMCEGYGAKFKSRRSVMQKGPQFEIIYAGAFLNPCFCLKLHKSQACVSTYEILD